MSKNLKKAKKLSTRPGFNRLADIMQKLRGQGGCAWDKKQTHSSLVKYLFEEAKEVRLAVRRRDWVNLEEELGDILLQVVFHSQIAKENGHFELKDVVHGICEKLVRRHPHVFGGKKVKSTKDILKQWDEIKRLEKIKLNKT